MLQLLHGTCTLRPYVLAFLASYLIIAPADLGRLRALLFMIWAFAVAFAAEWSSTRSGLPFGLYTYNQATRAEELFLSDVPFYVPLSYVFVLFACYCMGRIFGRGSRARVLLWSALAIVLLSAVMDPAAVQGERFFLGPIYRWAKPGPYFGVPWSNFAGWVIVTVVVVAGYDRLRGADRVTPRLARIAGALLYLGLVVFQFVVLCWLGELALAGAGAAVHVVFVGAALRRAASPPGAAPT